MYTEQGDDYKESIIVLRINIYLQRLFTIQLYFLSLIGISSAAGLVLRKLGNCSQGAASSNLRNSCANSNGSTTTRFFSSSYLN